MNPLRHAKIASTLSLFALLMIFVAPIVSQALMRHDYTPATHTQHHHSHGKPEVQTPISPGMTISHDARGYCALLSHHPVLSPEDSHPLAPRFVTKEKADAPLMAQDYHSALSTAIASCVARQSYNTTLKTKI
ncbi:MAG: DUF2946 domain-containing protein [Symbiopectobacterium sp.]|uniref:DUF2946 domain-containing protein n=1 Tax=Symbiopectobacterium sp. TaxID=2952789 RepID=UPI0039E7AC04